MSTTHISICSSLSVIHPSVSFVYAHINVCLVEKENRHELRKKGEDEKKENNKEIERGYRTYKIFTTSREY